ncbi:MAG: VOC family protein [Jiangellaceae bacterium]
MADYAPGMASWVDLGSPDVEASVRFYNELFGWTSAVAEEREARGYTTFSKDGAAVAAVGPTMSEDQPPTWMSYFATDDANAVVRRVEAAGGQVVMAPMDVMGYGRTAVFFDQAGAAFAVWQAGSMQGAELKGVPGSLSWNELTTRDVDGSKAFYGSVLGWGSRDVPMDPLMYTIWEVGDQTVAGMMPMQSDQWPADLPPHWMVYFEVADCDATAARATELGGSVSVPPTDSPAGRFAVLGDPQGAFFSVIASNPDFNA